MVGLIVDLKPTRIKEVQKRLQVERDIANIKLKVSKKVEKGIQENPVKSKFQID